jgi:glutamate racemase
MRPTILIADSCAGGLTVLKPFLDWAGDYDLIYLADGEKNPFGKKTKRQIISIVDDWLDYFKIKNLAALVIACNTASVAVQDKVIYLEKKYHTPIITMIQGTEKALEKNGPKILDKNIVLFGTKFTVSSPIYKEIIKRFDPKKVFPLEGTQTERMVARGLFRIKKESKAATEEIKKLSKNHIDIFFLGCTCFEFVKDKIKRSYPKRINFINPSKEISNIAKNILGIKHNKKKKLDTVKFYTTGEINCWRENINLLGKKVFNKKIRVSRIAIR